ncbi:MAG: MAPEG family protein [Myxococcota bacterium]
MLTPVEAFGLVVVALFFKMMSIALVQGYYRMTRKVYAKPEDAAAYGDGQVRQELPIVQRGQRALRNDLENIPIFLFVAWSYIELGCWEMGVHIYFPIFVLARFLHTIVYLKPKQPARTIAYATGALVTALMGGHIVWTVVSNYV